MINTKNNEERFKQILGEFDNDKNVLSCRDISPNSHKSVWWVCPIGHSYEKRVYERLAGSNCPFCSGRKVLSGYNDLATTNPELSAEFDYEKNAPLKPNEISKGIAKNIWWICEKGHSYQASPNNRSSGTGCPYCSGKRY